MNTYKYQRTGGGGGQTNESWTLSAAHVHLLIFILTPGSFGFDGIGTYFDVSHVSNLYHGESLKMRIQVSEKIPNINSKTNSVKNLNTKNFWA